MCMCICMRMCICTKMVLSSKASSMGMSSMCHDSIVILFAIYLCLYASLYVYLCVYLHKNGAVIKSLLNGNEQQVPTLMSRSSIVALQQHTLISQLYTIVYAYGLYIYIHFIQGDFLTCPQT